MRDTAKSYYSIFITPLVNRIPRTRSACPECGRALVVESSLYTGNLYYSSTYTPDVRSTSI